MTRHLIQIFFPFNGTMKQPINVHNQKALSTDCSFLGFEFMLDFSEVWTFSPSLAPPTCHMPRHHPTSAFQAIDCWPLTIDRIVDHWLWPKSKFFNWAGRFWFWAPFLHLRSLNPTFSSLWLNKTNEISFILSPLSWMVLLAIMHNLRIWLSFSRVVNCGGMWLVQFLS